MWTESDYLNYKSYFWKRYPGVWRYLTSLVGLGFMGLPNSPVRICQKILWANYEVLKPQRAWNFSSPNKNKEVCKYQDFGSKKKKGSISNGKCAQQLWKCSWATKRKLKGSQRWRYLITDIFVFGLFWAESEWAHRASTRGLIKALFRQVSRRSRAQAPNLCLPLKSPKGDSKG